MFENKLFWEIRDCGVLYYDIKDWDAEVKSLTTELTEEEKKSKFAKYYLRQIKMPTHENLKAAEFDNPLPPELMFMPEEYVSKMDSPLRDEMRSGYGVMDNGIGFSMSRVPLPGVTDEKIQYFYENFIPEGDLFYKCWYPGMHMRHYIAGCVEDVGLGMELINFLGRVGPADFAGSEDYEYKCKDLIAVCGGGGISWPLHDLFNHPRYALQANWFQYLPDHTGREALIIFWHGISWKDGKAIRMLPEGEKISIDRVRSHMNHSIWEYTQVAELVNTFWDDNH
jgi:hypothetical protein